MELKPCDLILVRGKGFLNEEIKEITHSTYSHVAGVVLGNMIVEAQGFSKVRVQSLEAYAGSYDVYRYEGLTNEQALNILKYVRKQVGKRYSYLLFLWEFFHYAFGLKIPNLGKQLICSTLWTRTFKKAGIKLCPGIRYPSPAEIAKSKLLRKVA